MTAHTLTRLRTMTVWELADRGRQELLKRVDRLPSRSGQSGPRARLARRGPALANPDSALEALRGRLGCRTADRAALQPAGIPCAVLR